MTEMTQTHRLQEVANLMLKIYRTLARMQYLDPSWIVEGPHNLDHMLSKYKEHNLDPAIIELYTLLPYVDNHGAESLDFFQGGQFFDARDEGALRDSRDPFYSSPVTLPPWRTPLSRLGNHDSVIFYDARRHLIALEDQMGYTTDHVIRAERDAAYARERQEGHYRAGQFLTPYLLTDQTEEELATNEHGNGYHNLNWRDAPDVLRDMLRWYADLVETPGGGGENSSSEWNHDVLVPLYRKHGWPGAGFDGTAFLVDKARVKAARTAKYHAEEPLRQLACLEGWISSDEEGLFKLRMEKAGSVDDEWDARWELWDALRRRELNRKALEDTRRRAEMDCPRGVCQQEEDLPLYELRQVKIEEGYARRKVEEHVRWGEKMDEVEKERSLEYQMRLRFLEKQARIWKMALDAAQEEVDRMGEAGKRELAPTATELHRQELVAAREQNPGTVIRENEKWMEDSTTYIQEIREWIKQLPAEGSEGVRQKIDWRISEVERCVEKNRKRIELAKRMQETGERPKRGLFYV